MYTRQETRSFLGAIAIVIMVGLLGTSIAVLAGYFTVTALVQFLSG